MWWVPAAALAGGLAGCGQPAALSVDGAWVRLAAVPGRPAAAYFTLHGGATDATLVAVRAPMAKRSELHESMGAGGMATMTPLGQLAVPARATVAFAPGGRHVMLFDIASGVKPGGTMGLGFAFADGRTLEGTARVLAAGDPAPAG